MAGRVVLHIDMDAFFAAVEERNNPHLQGKPIVVGADPRGGEGRGVVSTANYAARKYGIRSAMPISEAYRRCPTAVFLPVDFALYERVSGRIMQILFGCGDAHEQVSVDEAYIEFQNGDFDAAAKIAAEIKKKIFEAEGLTCSVGIGPNPLVAKIASDFKKPDGLTVVRPEGVEEFLAPLDIQKIPGIGPKSGEALRQKSIQMIGDLRNVERAELVRMFGKWGNEMYDKAHGLDDSPVGEAHEIKSIGEQETFEHDTLDRSFLADRLLALSESVWDSIEAGGVRPRSVTLTVRFRGFETLTRTHTDKEPLRGIREFKQEALRLLMPFLDRRENPEQKPIRLLGVRGERFAASEAGLQ